MTSVFGDDHIAQNNIVELPRVEPAPDLDIATLGPARITSPMAPLLDARQTTEHYVDELDRVLLDDTLAGISARGGPVSELPAFEPCGPRRKIFFDPSKTRAAIVTCGGLCPGLNDVIAGLVRTLTYHYKVRRVVGIRNGYQGFVAGYGHDVVELTPESVRDIVDRRRHRPRHVARAAGPRGDRRLPGAAARQRPVRGGRRRLDARARCRSPRTVAERGLLTRRGRHPEDDRQRHPATSTRASASRPRSRHASDAIRAAAVEARSTANGIGLVKLMGRHSGFIACYAALARNEADVVLIPEVPFALDGDGGLLALPAPPGRGTRARRRRRRRGGRPGPARRARRGQRRLRQRPAPGHRPLPAPAHRRPLRRRRHRDLDPLHRPELRHPQRAGQPVRLACTACGSPRPPCTRRCPGAPRWWSGRYRRRFVHIPMAVAVSRRNQVDPHGDLWMAVLESTGQPVRFA